jgi:hypothetical protein
MFIGNNQDHFKNFPIDHRRRRISARRAPTHYSNIPSFHHSLCERSELSALFFGFIFRLGGVFFPGFFIFFVFIFLLLLGFVDVFLLFYVSRW